MARNRRSFLKCAAGAGALVVLGNEEKAQASEEKAHADRLGVLVDTTRCVGCRRCEKACNEVNELHEPKVPFDDPSVFDQPRRMDANAFTVVNRYESSPDTPDKPVHAKMQCMHCLNPACVSACIVGALSKEPNGAVVYDADKCIGCRYCMMACPFQVPAYEYDRVLTPRVRKCTFCFEARLKDGGLPGCVESCPMQVMTFSKRTSLVRLAHQRLRKQPDLYVPHVYGENEVGGTSWMYLSGISPQKLGLPKLGYHPVPGYTEPIQHALFKWFLPPLGLYGTLGGIMWFLKSKKKRAKATSGEEGAHECPR